VLDPSGPVMQGDTEPSVPQKMILALSFAADA